MSTLRKRLLSTICMVAFGVCFAFAQTNTVKHVVDRGETLASIAKRYSTTEAKIIELNPDAQQFVYVGMELVIPNVQEQTQEIVPEREPVQIDTAMDSSNNVSSTVKETASLTPKREYSVGDFSFYGVSYLAAFDNAGEGCFMIGGEHFTDSGWGADFEIGTNYGLVDKDFAGVAFLVGPAYGYAYNNLLFSTSLDFVGTYYGTGESQKTGTNAKGEEYSYKGNDLKFNWGIALMPKLAIKLGKVTPWLGVNAQWTKGVDKLSVGFQIGIGFKV